MARKNIAERRLLLVNPDTGNKISICVEIGFPQCIEPDIQVACPVYIRGIMNRPIDIFGMDSINALACSFDFVENELKNLSGHFSVQWPDGEPYFDPPP